MSLAAKITHHTEGENRYIRVWREKTGEQRLKIAMELRRLVLKLAEEGIKNQKPNISSEDLKARIQERIYGFSFPFKKVTKRLNKAEIPYMVSGGIAVS